MEWIILPAIILGGIYWYKNHSGKAQDLQVENQFILTTNEADDAYKWLIEHLNKLIDEDIPKWKKEDAEGREKIKQFYKNEGKPLPKSFSKPLVNRDEQVHDYTQTLKDVKEMRDYVIKWGIKNRSTSVKERLEIAQDWNLYIQIVASRNLYRGFEGLPVTDDDYETQSVYLREIKNKYKQI